MNFEPLTFEDSEHNKPTKKASAVRTVAVVIALLAVAALASYLFLFRPAATVAAATSPLPTVVIDTPVVRKINEWDNYVGRFEASRAVEVRPRVTGQIKSVNFVDGAVVDQGQLLFTIDERPFSAALAEAEASLASARSDLALARIDLARAGRLVGNGAVSESEVDRLRARVQAAEAAVTGGEARVRMRALELDFTNVRAPIAGRVSSRRVDPGNLVMAGEGATSSLLTTINALDPIYVTFDASEAAFLKTRRELEAGERPTRVEVRLQDETDYRWQGKLDFTDNGLNPRAGTIRMRATIPNPDLFLTPGMFGNLRLASGGQTTALLVPDAAVQTDQTRKTLLVVDNDNRVVAKPVQLGPVIDGLRIIRSGLVSGDRVIISGMQMAMPGSKVQVKLGHIAPIVVPEEPVTPPIGGEATFAP